MSENPSASPLEPPYDPWRLEWLLDGQAPLDGDPTDRALAEMLAAAKAPASPAELAGQDAAVAAFLAHHAVLSAAPKRRSRRVPRVTALAAGAAGAVLLGGVAAAYTGSLPTPVQNLAHHVIGAPTASHGPSGHPSSPAVGPDRGPTDATTKPTENPVGPDATTVAALGLCEAYGRGGLPPSSVGYRSLERAAGTVDGIATYCDTLAARSGSSQPTVGGQPPTTVQPPGSPVPGTHSPAGRASANPHTGAPVTRPSLPATASATARPSPSSRAPHQVAVDR
jgi:hypothetical protein